MRGWRRFLLQEDWSGDEKGLGCRVLGAERIQRSEFEISDLRFERKSKKSIGSSRLKMAEAIKNGGRAW